MSQSEISRSLRERSTRKSFSMSNLNSKITDFFEKNSTEPMTTRRRSSPIKNNDKKEEKLHEEITNESIKNKRGRPSKLSNSPSANTVKTPTKRGRKPKNEETNKSTKQTKESKKKKVETINLEEEEDDDNDDDDQETNESDSDEEYKVQSEDEETEEESSIEEGESVQEESNEDRDDDEDYDEKKTKRTSKKQKKLTKPKSNTSKEIEENELINIFDMSEKVTQWKYELDEETQSFRKPILPHLTDKAIEPFLSNKSKPPKTLIYECPFCKKIFTYTLVFKTHLFQCQENKNVPDYVFYCSKHPVCEFIGRKKQDMINHFLKAHTKAVEDGKPGAKQILSATKQNQLDISRYYYLNRDDFMFAFNYFDCFIANSYKNLTYFDDFIISHDFDSNYKHWSIDLSENIEENLKFKFIQSDTTLPSTEFELKPFECFEYNQNENFLVLNTQSHVTALDWCPSKHEKSTQACTANQFLAFSTLPNDYDESLNRMHSQHFGPNYVYIFKLAEKHLFALYNSKLGIVNCLKWRPDYGASAEINKKISNFIGYLLAASSNGDAFIFFVEDMTKYSKSTESNSRKMKVHEPKKYLILRCPYAMGQCTAADWSLLNGATQIATGYTNGSIGIFHVNTNHLKTQCFVENLNEQSGGNKQELLVVYPIKTFDAHTTFVKTLKWSKMNSFTLASGSLFNREIKIWDTRNVDKSILDYEIFITEFDFSIHSNDLFMAKEINLRGENHVLALDLTFNIFNMDKDESRAHMSLFHTDATMSCIDQSDYLNKFLVCDNNGSVVLSKSNDTKFWMQKHKLMNYSYAQVAKLSVLNETDESPNLINKTYNLNVNKKHRTVLIDLERINNRAKGDQNQVNSMNIDLNSLTKIKWNPNVDFMSWYACSSLSGFIFIHKLTELKPFDLNK